MRRLWSAFDEALATTTLFQRPAPVSCHGFSLSLLVTVFCRSRLERLSFFNALRFCDFP
ncbi:hypothetical protein HPTD01_1293 [Halomonas sp. TD01]|nr:hypothetical protein HPTD01_1293 [Halomonas sp. TD01]